MTEYTLAEQAVRVAEQTIASHEATLKDCQELTSKLKKRNIRLIQVLEGLITIREIVRKLPESEYKTMLNHTLNKLADNAPETTHSDTAS